MGSQRVGHDWATDLIWSDSVKISFICTQKPKCWQYLPCWYIYFIAGIWHWTGNSSKVCYISKNGIAGSNCSSVLGLLCPPPGDLPNLGIKPTSPTLQVDYLPSELPGKPSVYSYANRMAISTLQGWNEVCIIKPKELIHHDHLVYTVVTVWLSVQFSRSVMSDSLRPHEPQHARPPCP